MAVIEFIDYRMKEISYKRNKNFDSNSELHVNNNFEFSFELDKEMASVIIKLTAGELDDERAPFKIVGEIEGRFRYSSDEDTENIGIEKLLASNCTAILYPYLRSAISSISTIGNEFPTYILPTINVSQLLEDVIIIRD